MDTVQCLRAEEVARRLRVGRSTAYKMMASGELPTIRIGRLLRVPLEDLRRWMEQRQAAMDETQAATEELE